MQDPFQRDDASKKDRLSSASSREPREIKEEEGECYIYIYIYNLFFLDSRDTIRAVTVNTGKRKERR